MLINVLCTTSVPRIKQNIHALPTIDEDEDTSKNLLSPNNSA